MSRKYFQRLAEFLLGIIYNDDKFFLKQALDCLRTITKYSGFQLYLVFKHDIFRLMFGILQTSPHKNIIISVLRMLGTLGAIDPLFINRTRKKLPSLAQISDASLPQLFKLIRKNSKREIHALEKLAEPQPGTNPARRLEHFKNNIQVIER